jgi:hypothetical protein
VLQKLPVARKIPQNHLCGREQDLEHAKMV